LKFIEQPLSKLRAVPDAQLRELAGLLEKRFPAGAVACDTELERRLDESLDTASPFLLLVTGAYASDDLRGLFGVGAILEGHSQGSGVTKALAAIEEMILARRSALQEDDELRAFFALQMGLAFA
jgi:hypothetical protein